MSENSGPVMREIKFRAWKKSEKRMLSWWELCDLHECGTTAGAIGLSDVLNGIYLEVVMQYTGLKDKNGVEIYEGDIVRQFVSGCDVEFHTGFTQEVIFRSGAFGYHTEPAGFISYADNLHFNWIDGKSIEIEVIGNIYENPELIKVDHD